MSSQIYNEQFDRYASLSSDDAPITIATTPLPSSGISRALLGHEYKLLPHYRTFDKILASYSLAMVQLGLAVLGGGLDMLSLAPTITRLTLGYDLTNSINPPIKPNTILRAECVGQYIDGCIYNLVVYCYMLGTGGIYNRLTVGRVCCLDRRFGCSFILTGHG